MSTATSLTDMSGGSDTLDAKLQGRLEVGEWLMIAGKGLEEQAQIEFGRKDALSFTSPKLCAKSFHGKSWKTSRLRITNLCYVLIWTSPGACTTATCQPVINVHDFISCINLWRALDSLQPKRGEKKREPGRPEGTCCTCLNRIYVYKSLQRWISMKWIPEVMLISYCEMVGLKSTFEACGCVSETSRSHGSRRLIAWLISPATNGQVNAGDEQGPERVLGIMMQSPMWHSFHFGFKGLSRCTMLYHVQAGVAFSFTFRPWKSNVCWAHSWQTTARLKCLNYVGKRVERRHGRSVGRFAKL